jgi:hypothetical protein
MNAPSKEATDRFNALYDVLDEEASAAIKYARAERTAFARRAAFRSVFASIEGLVYLLKDQVLALFPGKRGDYSVAEVALLREETYALGRHGEAQVQRRFLRLEENLQFAWRMYFRGLPIKPDLNFADQGWVSFKRCLQIRNRITHPKSREDMQVSDEELEDLSEMHAWIHATTWRNVARAILEYREQEYARLDQELPTFILEWLDARGDIDKRSSSLSPTDLRELSDDEQTRSRALQQLEKHGLICSTELGVSFTVTCADYIKRRQETRIPDRTESVGTS